MSTGIGIGLSYAFNRGASGPYRVSITADADDGHERLDTNALNTASVVAGDAGTYLAAAFWRFTGIAVPIGTTITSATITVTSSASGGSGTAVIRAQKSASPAAVSAGNLPSSWTGASGTTATTAITGAAAGVNVYDVTDIVQELVDQAGWPATGGAMNFRVAEDAGGFSTTYVDSPSAGSAVLTISANSQTDVTAWPDLKLWLDFAEGSGTTLTDKSVDPITFNITTVGAHDPWSNAGVFTSASAINPTDYSYAVATRDKIEKCVPYGKAWILELWGTAAALHPTNGRTPITIGRIGTSGAPGFRYRIETTASAGSEKVYLTSRGATNTAHACTFSSSLTSPASVAHHVVIYQHGSNSATPLVCGGSTNGTPVSTANLSGSVGEINLPMALSEKQTICIGADYATPISGVVCPFQYKMLRLWILDAIPSNINDIMTEMYNAGDPTPLPSLLRYRNDGDNLEGVRLDE